ncbi:MAG: hypothetical protein EBZ77_04865 [Chitinophagia bacterium]|nr:hypothetical protein [Chitinophagia bacterium]
MANSVRNNPGTESTSNVEPAELDINPLDQILPVYEQNKKTISTVLTVVLVGALLFVVYQYWWKAPNEEKASAAMAMPQLYFQVDSVNLALNGDGKNPGFAKLETKYAGTSAGNLAHYYAGICYLKMGDFKKAIKSLKDFDGKGTVLSAQANGSIGIAYMESGDKTNAIEYFKKATADKEDILVTPLYLYHLGLAYMANNQANEAKATFKRIRDEYPRSLYAREMDKELAKMGDIE